MLKLKIQWVTLVERLRGRLEMQTWREVQGGDVNLGADGSKVNMKATHMVKAQR